MARLGPDGGYITLEPNEWDRIDSVVGFGNFLTFMPGVAFTQVNSPTVTLPAQPMPPMVVTGLTATPGPDATMRVTWPESATDGVTIQYAPWWAESATNQRRNEEAKRAAWPRATPDRMRVHHRVVSPSEMLGFPVARPDGTATFMVRDARTYPVRKAAETYRLRYRAAGAETWEERDMVTSTDRTLYLTPETAFEFQVLGTVDGLDSEWSESVTATTGPRDGPAPG